VLKEGGSMLREKTDFKASLPKRTFKIVLNFEGFNMYPEAGLHHRINPYIRLEYFKKKI
jgi:hypothetical protein